MDKEKSNNNFYRYVMEGDWRGYKNEVSKQSNSLYRELGKKVPPLAKLDKLLLDPFIWKRIIGNLILMIIYSLLLSPLLYIDYINDHQILQILLALIPTFIIHNMMVYVLVVRDKNFARWKILPYSLLKMIEILFRHFFYISIIFWKNKKDTFFIFLSIVSTIWGIYVFNIFIVETLFYENTKHYQFENIYTPILIVVAIGVAVAGLNVLLLIVGLNKKCNDCGKEVNNWNSGVNISLITITCFFISFVSVFALLLSEQSNTYIRVMSVMVVVFVFLLEKLLFGNNNRK